MRPRPLKEIMQDEINRLLAAIRKHRDQRGDDRCWLDDEELYRVLPEGYQPPPRDSSVEIENCRRFIACRQNPATTYVSPEREIERLRAKLAEIASKLSSIVCTEGNDVGVVLLSSSGPTHWDESVKCQVYDYEFFSPLGDALMELYRMATDEPVKPQSRD